MPVIAANVNQALNCSSNAPHDDAEPTRNTAVPFVRVEPRRNGSQFGEVLSPDDADVRSSTKEAEASTLPATAPDPLRRPRASHDRITNLHGVQSNLQRRQTDPEPTKARAEFARKRLAVA